MKEKCGFVTDGFSRARKASQPIVRSEVEEEFAERLRNASRAERRQIRAEIDREIQKRLNAIAPPDALY